MANRLTALLVILICLAPAMLGSTHTEGEVYLSFLFAVFAVVWLSFFVYAFFISRKQADLTREIDALRYPTKDIEDG